MRCFRCLVTIALLFAAGTPTAYACTQEAADSYGEFIVAERAKRREVKGTFRIVKVEEQPYSEEVGDWRVIYGQITLRSGKVIETVHTEDSLLLMCGRPEGPVRDAIGTFYLNRKKKDGRFEIFDWHGDYLPKPVPSKAESGS